MKVVFDTNIWLSAMFWKGEANKVIELATNKKITIITTEDILSEIIEVLNKEEKFKKFILDRKQAIEDFTRTILSLSTLIETKSELNLIKDHPKDNIILEAALDGKADYIVTYDKHILNMIEFRGTKIVTPGEFLIGLK